jgi:hypothetical protein
MWMFVGLCIAAVIAGGLVWVLFRKYNDEEEKMNELGY